MYRTTTSCRFMGKGPFPDNLIPEILKFKNRVHQDCQVVAGSRIATQKDAARALKNAVQLREARGHHGHVSKTGALSTCGRTRLMSCHKHHWTVVEAAQGFESITSDNPVVRLAYSGPMDYHLEGGWDRKGANIILPLSPRYLARWNSHAGDLRGN